MPRVRFDERVVVREAIGVVAQTLNMLMAQAKWTRSFPRRE